MIRDTGVLVGSTWSSADKSASDFHPESRLMEVDVHYADLPKDERRKRVEIDGVNAARNDEVSNDSEKKEQVDAGVEIGGIEKVFGNASPRGGCEGTTGDKEEASMEFGILAPKDRQGKGHREASDVPQGDEDVRVGIGISQDAQVKALHEDGDGNAKRGNQGAQSYAEPAEAAMQTNIARAYEGGLKDEKEHPAKEDGSVNIEEQRARRGRVDEIPTDGMTKAVDYDGQKEQRHREVEIVLQ